VLQTPLNTLEESSVIRGGFLKPYKQKSVELIIALILYYRFEVTDTEETFSNIILNPGMKKCSFSHIGAGMYEIWGIHSNKIIDMQVWKYIRNESYRGLVQVLSCIKIVLIMQGIKSGLIN
jgi:hypothetical protein